MNNSLNQVLGYSNRTPEMEGWLKVRRQSL